MEMPLQNFISPSAPVAGTPAPIQPPLKRRGFFHSWRGRILSVVIFIVLVLIVLGSMLWPHYGTLKQVYALSLQGQNHLLAAEDLLKAQKFPAAITELSAAEQDFHQAGQDLKLMEVATLFRNSTLKSQLLVAEDLIFIGEKSSIALKEAAELGGEVLVALGSDKIDLSSLTPAAKEKALGVVLTATPKLEKIQADFRQVSDRLVILNKRHPAFVFDSLIIPLQQKIPQLQRALDGALLATKLIPSLAGYPVEKSYLFLLENNREMRPAGGFIGTYGILQIKNAEIKKFFTDNTYNLDYPAAAYLKVEPPAPIKKYLKQDYWFFRDANWWPDFPTSAHKAEWFYQQEGGKEKVDGVIAITPTVIEEMLGLLGEIQVGNSKFNKQNFWESLQYQVEYGYYLQGIPEENRKDIVGALGQQLLSRLYTLPLNQWPALLDILQQQLQEKQILLYFNDAASQAIAENNDWAGKVKDFDGDYLMVVDANLAALKTDSVLSRSLLYSQTPGAKDQSLRQVAVTYQNTGEFTWKTTRYRTYTRLYVPKDSQLVSIKVGNREITRDNIDVYEEFGKTVFGVFFEIEPQAKQTVIWQYRLPGNLLTRKEYKLLVQKQPGILSWPLQLDLQFDQKVKSNAMGEASVEGNKIKHGEVLRQDQIYSVWLK